MPCNTQSLRGAQGCQQDPAEVRLAVGNEVTKVESALDDGHPCVNDLGTTLQDASCLQASQQILQQLSQQFPLVPAE